MKKTILYTLFLLSTLGTLCSCQESKGERFEREAKEFTQKNCPSISSDGLIRTDSMVCHNDGKKDMQYFYTILNEETEDVLLRNQENVRVELHRGIINSVDMRHQKEAGLNFHYIYRSSKTGKEVLHFVFTPQDYR